MNIEVGRIRTIENECIKDFELKTHLSEVEQYGLEMILTKLLKDYYEEMGLGEDISRPYNEVDTLTRHLEDCLDVLDGYNNVLYVGEHKITSIYLTTNDIVILKCIKEDCDRYEDEESVYYATVN